MFRDGLAPLAERGQLGSILLQYPRWVFPSNENRAAIEEAAERLAGWRCAVEFRNGSWLNEKNAERTLRFLSDHDLAFVMVDEPQGFKSSVPPTVAVTSSDLAIVRFHGRNADTWEAGASPRPSASATSTRATSWRLGPAHPRGGDQGARDVRADEQLLRNYGTTNAREIAALLNDLQLPEDEPLRSR